METKKVITYQWQTSRGSVSQELMSEFDAKEWMKNRLERGLNKAFYQSLVLFKVTKTVEQEPILV